MVSTVTDSLSAAALSDSLIWLVGASLLFCALVAASLYTCALIQSINRRRWRVALFLPVMLGLTMLPNVLFSRDTHILGVGVAACLASWWAAHKSLSYLLNYRTPPEVNAGRFRALLTFCACIVLPVRVARSKARAQGFARPAMRAMAYVSVLTVVGARLLPHVAACTRPLRAFFRGLIIYATGAFISDLCAAVAESVGVGTEPAFNSPWMASSLSEFWTKRWNLPASDVLRDSVYYPAVDVLSSTSVFGHRPHELQRICSASDRRAAVLAAPASARVVSSLITFFISGVMHELVIFCLTGYITGEMTLFFTIHGFLVVTEGAAASLISTAAGGPVWTRVPVLFRRLATVSLVLITGHWLFFEPLVRSAIDIKAGQNMMALYNSMVRAPRTLQHLRGLNSSL